MSFSNNEKTQDYLRALWHFCGVGGSALIFWFCGEVLLGFLIAFGFLFLFVDWRRAKGDSWAEELIRFVTGDFFFNMLRDSELNSLSTGSKYIFAGLIIAVMQLHLGLPKEIAVCGVLLLAVGDPMARLIGKEWKGNGFNGLVSPRLRKKRLYGKKTFIGSSSFFCFGVFSVWAFCSVTNVEINWSVLIVGAIVATLVELYVENWDNFWVPLSAISVMWYLGGF
ncbi:hypothetical protein HN643_03700 [Candidatus Falkowbacteria bacterium]|jgi:dolichol kinase|nr:hypothetical protein [Candidatus Falkowbacteria bacterium]MBT5503618.1 hypothetical protein [Candidatus Falkowbacteria bacterium]MBT6574478.1 hypothetical protein [Candidatus Falkowbacteria bacterium]MBT7500745.1 hypothetical protein [Candidatus Falkowbacteria bacterium]